MPTVKMGGREESWTDAACENRAWYTTKCFDTDSQVKWALDGGRGPGRRAKLNGKGSREGADRESQSKALSQGTTQQGQGDSGGCSHVAATRETIITITQPISMDSQSRVKSSLLLSSYPSLAQSDQSHTPPPGLFVSPGTGIHGASPQKQD